MHPVQAAPVKSALLAILLTLSTASFGARSASADIEPLLPLQEPVAAPDFKLVDLHGNTHTLADYQGQVLVVNFWAVWCAPCRHEMPSLQRLWEQLRDRGVTVLGINVGDQPAAIEKFVAEVPVDFPLLLDENLVATMDWEVQPIPTTFVVDRQGQRVYAEVGDKPWDDPVIVQQIETLLEAKPAP